jgi:hypothetical protein
VTSFRQIESNCRNALRSTGPKTEAGKQRSSKNAVRHGLTAETVIEPLEDPEDYKAFEQAITADYDAETAVERESFTSASSQASCSAPRLPRPAPFRSTTLTRPMKWTPWSSKLYQPAPLEPLP